MTVMSLDEMLSEPIQVQILRIWQEMSYRGAIAMMEHHVVEHGCNAPMQSGICVYMVDYQRALEKNMKEYDDKIAGFLKK
jgi:hypothetical protein